MATAKGNRDALAGTGFTITKEPEQRHLPAIGQVILSNGESSGQLVASINAVLAKTGYQYEITDTQPDEATKWTGTPSGTSKFTFYGLQPGKQYWVRVSATGARNQLQYSSIASKFVQ